MELVKDIYFNTDKLIENTKVKVSYTGKLYQGNNEKVFLHYGYGKDWNNVNEIEMSKTDLGYQAELDLTGCDTINFCFKNQNNEWDNNCGNNYVFDIEKNVANNATAESGGNLVFWGKTFGKTDEKETSPNIYWGSDAQNVSNSTPNCVDAVIPAKQEIINEPIANAAVNTEEITNECVVNELANPVINKAPVSENSIALAPTGFNYWTTKIKETVCNFFEYIPKLISGNYKRNLSNNKNK